MADSESRYKIALAGSLPSEQANGWLDDEFAEELDSDRAKIRYALVSYSVMSSKEVTATGRKILTMQMQRIEPIADAESASREREIINLFERRTGQTTLFPARTADNDDEADEAEAAEDRKLFSHGH